MGAPAADRARQGTVDEPIREGPGSLIGPYKLLEQLGEGGFGVVFLAEQTGPVRRKVALKVLKPGMDTRQVIARFEAERQALAIMDHPNIAKVFDGGATVSGRPYFVMELVRGVPITDFCDQNRLTPRERLELFLHVCQAVQHAHQKGIIHRDLKPSNVLVSRHDTTPVVKVIDFGVAKALGQELTDKTLFTGLAQMIGTPLYMSPEQAGMSDLDVDTRSDIYSLGVLLYELLTGRTPFDRERFKGVGYDELRRIIREEEPPKPSTRLSELKDSLPSISAQRHTEPAKLTKLVRGELDWIVMKALEKDRNRRYETANGFAQDVHRYLADEAVLACPPSVGYRLRKFTRRNKGGLAVAALVLFFLVLLGSSVGWAVRDRAAREAEAARQQGERQGKVAGQIELISAEVDQLEGEQKWPDALAAARRAEAAVAGGEADEATAQRARERLRDLVFIDRLEQLRMERVTTAWQDTEPAFARAFRDYGVDIEALPVEASIERLKARPALAIPLAAALDDWAFLRRRPLRGDAAGWKRLVAVARGIDADPLRDQLRSTWGRPVSETQDELRRLADSIDVRAHHPATLFTLADTLQQVQLRGSAVRVLRDAQSVYPGDYWLNAALGHFLHAEKDLEGAILFTTVAVSLRPRSLWGNANLPFFLSEYGKLDEAIAAHRRNIEVNPKRPEAYTGLGITLRAHGKPDEAVAACRKAIGLEPSNSFAYYHLGRALRDQNRRAEANAAFDKAIELFRKAIELNPKAGHRYWNLGLALHDRGKLKAAIDAFRTAIAFDPKSPANSNLGETLRAQRKLDEAIDVYRKAVEADPKDGPYNNLGNVLLERGKPDEAIDVYRKAIKVGPKNATAYHGLGIALLRQKKVDEAIVAFRTAIELDPRSKYAPYIGFGNALRDQKRLPEAIAAYRKAIEVDPKYTAAAGYINLSGVFERLNRLDEAIDACRKAIETDQDYATETAYGQLGSILRKRGSVDKTDSVFGEIERVARKAFRQRPDDARTRNALAQCLNGWAYVLATLLEPKLRDPGRALSLAQETAELAPKNGMFWRTLGVAHYRTGNWTAARGALEKSIQLGFQRSSSFFFLAMAHWRLGEKDKARGWYDRAVRWMDRNQPKSEDLRRFRAEAEELLKLKEKK
jgi:serine/threonine protein kinase/tetratricopeptide (TPR) repeat protein